MSKLKINDNVIVKENGKVGVIKGREIKPQPNGRVSIEYVVKTGEGFSNWGNYTKRELEKVRKIKTTKPFPALVVDAAGGYKVTLVAVVKRDKVWKDSFDLDGFYKPYFRKGKDLSIGYAIYNPNDAYDPDLGVRIATHRAKKTPFCHLISDFSGEFNTETINALLKVKGEYIAHNIDEFVR